MTVDPHSLDASPEPSGWFTGQRVNRRGYWAALVVLAAGDVVLGLISGQAAGLGSLLGLWLNTLRLHDIGRSGWWQASALGVALILTAGFAVLPFPVALSLVAGFPLLWHVVLGVIPGSAGPNRFGAPPGRRLWADDPGPSARPLWAARIGLGRTDDPV